MESRACMFLHFKTEQDHILDVRRLIFASSDPTWLQRFQVRPNMLWSINSRDYIEFRNSPHIGYDFTNYDL